MEQEGRRLSHSAHSSMRSHTNAARFLVAVTCLLLVSAHAETIEGKVVRVADGDSLTILSGNQQIRIRLLEIDAPERGQAFGTRSRESLTELCATKQARVDWQERDQYGRTLGRVWCDGVDVNAEQVRRGMAWVFDRYVRDKGLYALQDEARVARRGLWTDEGPTPPWEWRRLKKRGEMKASK